MTIFYITASLVTLVLAIYATYLLLKVYQLKQSQKHANAVRDAKHDAQLKSIIESINSIAAAMKQKQCPTIEGCIRLKVLLDQLRLADSGKDNFKVFYTIYDKTAHIPTHQAWKDLKREEKQEFSKYMTELEEQYQSDIDEAVESVIVHFTVIEQTAG